MGRKREYDSVIAVDPSWRGTGIVVHRPSEDLTMTFRMDLLSIDMTIDGRQGNHKKFDTPDQSRDLVYKLMCYLMKNVPDFTSIDLVVIEGQFKPKMKVLLQCFSNQFRCFLGPKAKIIIQSAVSTKNHYKLATKNYYQNKKRAVEFVQQKRKELIGYVEGRDLSHDECDAIILLNHTLETRKISFMSRRFANAPKTNGQAHVKRVPTTTYNTADDADGDAPLCPDCQYPCAHRERKDGTGAFWSCPNYNNGVCPRDGKFVCSVGDEPNTSMSGAKVAGSKRRLPPASNPKVKVPATGSIAEPAAMRYLAEITDTLNDIHSCIEDYVRDLHAGRRADGVDVGENGDGDQ